MGLRNITIPVTRLSGPTTWSNGRPVSAGANADFNISCSIQPLRARDKEMLPEGYRNSEAFNLFTGTKLNTVEDRNPDKVTWQGEVFEVLSVERWTNEIISHYKAVIVKQ